MVYLTDGSSHRNGVANEHATVDFINRRSVAIRAALVPPGHTLVQVGGTRTKVDARVIKPDGNCGAEITISIKNHTKGTFDWTNITRIEGVPSSLKEELKRFKAGCVPYPKTREEAEPFRDSFNDIFSQALKSLENDDAFIRSVLRSCYEKNPEYLIVNNVVTGEYILARTQESTPELATKNEHWNYFLKFGRGVTSGQVWRRCVHGKEVDTSLRLRLVSNNGLWAFFGPKGSVPCFKVQQDGVDEFIRKLHEPVRETWT
jgi:hypothetical protein